MIVNEVNKHISKARLGMALDFLMAQCLGPLSIFLKDAVVLHSLYTEYEREARMNIDRVSELNELKLSAIELARKLDGYQKDFAPDNLKQLLTSTLLLNDSFPFVDRLKFRNKIEKALHSNEPDFIFVEGE